MTGQFQLKVVGHKFHLIQSCASVIKESTLYIFTDLTLHHLISNGKRNAGLNRYVFIGVSQVA